MAKEKVNTEPVAETPAAPEFNIDEIIENTRNSIADIINQSQLPLSIIKLILENFVMQCNIKP